MLCSFVSFSLFLKKFSALILLIFLLFLRVPAIGLVIILFPFLSIRVSGEQLTMEKFLSQIIKDSGDEFIFINFQKKFTGLIVDLFLYLVQILI